MRRWRLNLDLVSGGFDVVDFDHEVKPIGWRAQGQRLSLPLVVENLEPHTSQIEPQATSSGTIPLLDNWETEIGALETDNLVKAVRGQGDIAHGRTPSGVVLGTR